MGDTYKVTRSNITQVDKEGNLPPNNDSDYNLPIASPSILGGVRPTKERTTENVPVAVDGQGGLWAPDGSYTLPVATTDTLGGVKPNTKTEAMTQPVGVDAEGKLYTEPGGEQYELPVASPTTLGGVKPESKTGAMTQSVGVDEEGGLWTEPGSGGQYELPVASSSTLGGVKPESKTGAMTQSVGVDAEGGLWTEPGSGGQYELPVDSSSTLGGVKPESKTGAMTQPVGVDEEGKLYTEPGSGGSYELPVAGSDTLGGVQAVSGSTYNENFAVEVNIDRNTNRLYVSSVKSKNMPASFNDFLVSVKALRALVFLQSGLGISVTDPDSVITNISGYVTDNVAVSFRLGGIVRISLEFQYAEIQTGGALRILNSVSFAIKNNIYPIFATVFRNGYPIPIIEDSTHDVAPDDNYRYYKLDTTNFTDNVRTDATNFVIVAITAEDYRG